jgi:hypothetical protein
MGKRWNSKQGRAAAELFLPIIAVLLLLLLLLWYQFVLRTTAM